MFTRKTKRVAFGKVKTKVKTKKMPFVTVYVKVLSGEMISLEVPENMTSRQFYGQAHYNLPEDVRSEEEYQMTLLRTMVVWDEEEKEEKEEAEELLADDEVMEVEEGEVFLAVMDSAKYDIVMNPYGWDAYERTREENYLFDANEYSVYRKWGGVTETLRRNDIIYHGTEDDSWYSSENVEMEWVGRFRDELAIEIPEDAVLYGSLEALAVTLMGRLPGLSRRVQAYLVDEWMRQWDQYRGPFQEEEEEEGQEEEIDWDDQGAAWPDNQ